MVRRFPPLSIYLPFHSAFPSCCQALTLLCPSSQSPRIPFLFFPIYPRVPLPLLLPFPLPPLLLSFSRVVYSLFPSLLLTLSLPINFPLSFLCPSTLYPSHSVSLSPNSPPLYILPNPTFLMPYVSLFLSPFSLFPSLTFSHSLAQSIHSLVLLN